MVRCEVSDALEQGRHGTGQTWHRADTAVEASRRAERGLPRPLRLMSSEDGTGPLLAAGILGRGLTSVAFRLLRLDSVVQALRGRGAKRLFNESSAGQREAG